MTEQEKKGKIEAVLDLLRLKIIQQRELTEQIAQLYHDLNELHGSPIKLALDVKSRNKPGWGPDPNFNKPATSPESQVLRDHQLTREF